MTRREKHRPSLLPMILAAGLLALPVFALAQTSTPAPITQVDPPGTALGRAATGAITAVTAPFAPLPGSAAYERQRMSQIIGANVYNAANESIGEVDDILLNGPPGAAISGPMAVIQVGGFLGIGGRLVLVPLSDLRWNSERERIVLPSATKATLETQPAFEYSALRRG